MRIFIVTVLILLNIILINGSKDWSEDMYPLKWNDYSRNKIEHMLNRQLNGNVAKNLILFLGDGMGMTTGIQSNR